MASYQPEKLLILANTYPNPSAKHRETNCVAAVTESGQMRRLYPVPYRLLDDGGKFKKWEWISAGITKAAGDHRPESYRIDVDSIMLHGQVPTANGWEKRIDQIRPHMVDNFRLLEDRRQQSGETLGVMGPVELIGLDITPHKDSEWTQQELSKLNQDGLFDSEEVRNRVPLRKVPYQFHYRYRSGGVEYRHMITDWEAGTLYWRCVQRYGPNWEEKFREKLLTEFGTQKDLLFLMGTVHRFPDIWLIVSLIYPPRGAWSRPQQGSLFDQF
ncbi:MAG: hypothetical protein H6642_07135 [Caldilineaceae bacterium]|nr:hypothetical protein [Caldilineaceae bacterium]